MFHCPLRRDMKYLSNRALEGLKDYKYKSAGATWMDEIHNPFWNCTCHLHSPVATAAAFFANLLLVAADSRYPKIVMML